MDKLKDRAKEAAGAVTGDEKTKDEGRADQQSGTVKEKKGKVKDLLSDRVEYSQPARANRADDLPKES